MPKPQPVLGPFLLLASLHHLACGNDVAAGTGDVTGTTIVSGLPTTNPEDDSTPTTTTSGAPAFCGDGVVDEGEQCDLGPDGNGDNLSCKTDCTVNVCGDGKVYVGVDKEECDDGLKGNADHLSCTSVCRVNVCGDGKVHAGYEFCDEGVFGNGNSLYCKDDCTFNVCGDGELLVGYEICDYGMANSNEYGALCTSECKPGKFCGDNVVQPEGGETCDLGVDNGTKKGDSYGILCDIKCNAQRLRGFVTSEAFAGNLGGVLGADAKCRDAAAKAGLSEPERFHAFISTGTLDAKDRFKGVSESLPYVLVGGSEKFADNFPSLLASGPLGGGIYATETQQAVFKEPVATNTIAGGVHFSPSEHCQGWTTDSDKYKGVTGLNAVKESDPDWGQWQLMQAWLSAETYDCNNKEFRLYCLEI